MIHQLASHGQAMCKGNSVFMHDEERQKDQGNGSPLSETVIYKKMSTAGSQTNVCCKYSNCLMNGTTQIADNMVHLVIYSRNDTILTSIYLCWCCTSGHVMG